MDGTLSNQLLAFSKILYHWSVGLNADPLTAESYPEILDFRMKTK